MKKRDMTGRLPFKHILLLFILPIGCMIISLCLGRMVIKPGDVWNAFLSKTGIGNGVSIQIEKVIWSMRLPRIFLAALVGMGLSVSGCTYQSLFANPLATPDTLGVASGSAFGAVLALLLGFDLIGIQLLALVFGFLAVVLTGFTANGKGDFRLTPVLAGIMIGSLFTSLVSLLKFTADTESQLPAITYWLMGSMESASFSTLLLGAPPIIIGIVVLLMLRWKMNLLPLSDDEIRSTGINLKALRLTAEICATMITASCVSMCGQVGWVGLLVPHICRMKWGSNHVALLPASVGVGAAFMVLVDTAARTISPKEIPISILTAIIGAPFFIYLLRKKGGWRL